MNMLARGALAVLLFLAIAGCNSDALPPASGFTSVSGTIVDSVTTKPIAGAIVTVDTVLSGTTDAAGRFSIEKVPSGIVDYTVQARGYKVLSATATVEPGKPYELDLTLATQSTH